MNYQNAYTKDHPHKMWNGSTHIDTTYDMYRPTPWCDHLLESSRRDDSNKCSHIDLGEEIEILELKIHFLSGAPLILEQCYLSCPGWGI